MKKLPLSILLIGSLAFSQTECQNSIDQKSIHNSDYTYRPGTLGTRIIGSPFVDINFKMGAVFGNGTRLFEAPMRYNSNREVIEYLYEGSIKKELPRHPHISAEIDGKEYKVMEFYENGEKRLGYLNPLMQEGDIMIYFRPYKEILKEDVSPLSRRNYAYCQDASSYYIKSKALPAVKTRLTREGITSHLQQHSEKVGQYIKGFNLDLRKEADAIRVLEFYNSLNS